MVENYYSDVEDYIFDWSKAWQKRISRSGLQANLSRQGVSMEDFWKRYDSWQEILRRNGYPGRLLDCVLDKIEPDFSILDIGSGAGAFALSLAKSTRLVTAIEPSIGQAARLRENAGEKQISNLVVIERRWEDIDLSEIGQHDIVLAAYCFQMEDIRSALEKMCMAACRYLVLIHTAGHDLIEPMRHMLGIETGPDYIYLYNILYQMGYRADVEVIDRDYRTPLDIQMDMFRCNPGLSEEQCRQLTGYLEEKGRILFYEGKPWIERQHKDAMIWVENRQNTLHKEDHWENKEGIKADKYVQYTFTGRRY